MVVVLMKRYGAGSDVKLESRECKVEGETEGIRKNEVRC
jgi:hypothetical protein